MYRLLDALPDLENMLSRSRNPMMKNLLMVICTFALVVPH